MSHIQYGNKKILFEIRRSSRRKTVAIKIDPMASVVVYSPQFLKADKIEEIVGKRAQWIIEK